MLPASYVLQRAPQAKNFAHDLHTALTLSAIEFSISITTVSRPTQRFPPLAPASAYAAPGAKPWNLCHCEQVKHLLCYCPHLARA